MKKTLFLIAVALMLVACNQKESKKQMQSNDNEMVIPTNAPSLPSPSIPIQINKEENPTVMVEPSSPVLKLEEGKPLDLSQLQGDSKSFDERVASQIDTVRYKAEHGDANFQFVYGVCYEKGWGVKQDMKQALAWYQKAAKQDNGPAYNSIGNIYRNGKGMTADPNQAFEWYQKGANAKDAQAMLNLGNCYYYGIGTEKDEPTAINWWNKAADAGNIYAMAQMGDCYYYGLCVEKNLSKAIDYYMPAAEKNISSAQYRLGVLYYTGYGVGQDQTQAKLLLQKASNSGMKEAQDFLDKYYTK